MELLHQCRDQAHKFYVDLLMAAEKSLNDTLFEQAEKSSNNEEQQRFFEAMQELKENSQAIKTTFHQSLNHHFQTFIDGTENDKAVEQSMDINSLSLVQRDDLEDELAISVIVSKSNSRNSETLWKLNRRLAVLRGGKTVTDENNPFGPNVVCESLQDAIAQLNIDNKMRILLYKQLGKLLIISFSNILEKLNKLLIENRILPNLRFSASKTSETVAPTRPANINPVPAITAAESEDSIAHQQQLYDAIRKLQSTSGPRTQTAGGVDLDGIATDGVDGSQEAFSAVDYALALSAIQQSQSFLHAASVDKPLSADTVEEKLFNQLSKQSNKESRHKMTRDHADTVDLVGMIFRYMLDDPKLHDAAKSIMSHLHTPYLKLALLDKTFLDNHNHSARVLLNRMAEVGGRWIKDEKDRNALPKIKTIVETILKGFIDDISIFDRVLEDFTRFAENLEKRSRMVEKRNTEAQQGLERLELSKFRAGDELEARFKKEAIPDNIANLLRKPWSDFLSFTLLRHGEDSSVWASSLKVVDGVIWSVRNEQTQYSSKEALQTQQQKLEQSVGEGLATIGYDQEAAKSLMKSLHEAHELAYHNKMMAAVSESHETNRDENSSLKNNPSNEIKSPQEQATKTEKISKPVKTAPPLSEAEQSMVDKLKAIAFGTWFEFQKETNNIQLKLAWFSKVTSHYMFVDHSGVKQSMETQTDLAKGLVAGHISIIEPEKRPFMERALEAVFDKLNILS